MRVVDLTLPIQENMDYYGTGQLPWEIPFTSELTVPADGGRQLGSFNMYCEPGTRYLCTRPKKIGDLFKSELSKLQGVDAVCLNVPKEPKVGGNFITPADIQAAVKTCVAKPGDAILLHTGHGDDEKYYKMGPQWEPQSPCMHPDTIPVLAGYLKEMQAPLFGYDTANISWQCTDLNSLHRTWAQRNPRPALGSPEAKAVSFEYFKSGTFAREMGPLAGLLLTCDALGGLVNLGAIKSTRFKLNIAPLKVITWGYVPATIFAIED